MRKFITQLIAIFEIAGQRIWSSFGIHLAITLGIMVATTTICALMLYAESVNVSILWERLATAHEKATYDLLIKGERDVIDSAIYQEMDSKIQDQMRVKVGLPLTRVGRHAWSKSLIIILPGESSIGKRNQLTRTRFQFYADIKDNIEIISGGFPKIAHDPQDTVEVMITEKLANELGLIVGDEFSVEDFTGSDNPMHVTTRISAVIQLKNSSDSFWFYAPWFLDEALTIPEESFFNSIALNFVPSETEVTWAANFDENRINITNVNMILTGLSALKFELTSDLKGLTFLTNIDNTLQGFRSNTFMLKALLILLGAPVIGISLYFITMSSQLMVDHQRGEIAVLKSRGMSTEQILVLYLIQGLIIAGFSVGLAPLLAIPVAQAIGKTTTFLQFTHSTALPISLRLEIFGYATISALLSLIATWFPTIKASQETIVTYRRTQAREIGSSIIHRFYLDFALLLLGGWSYYRLNNSGTIINRTETGGLTFDPLLLVTPLILTFSLSFIVIRIFPILSRGFAYLVSFSEANASLIALRQIARTPNRHLSLILILTYTLSLGLFSAVIADAFDRNYSDQAMYSAGADLRTHEFNYDTASWDIRPINEYTNISGVSEATPVLRSRLVGRQAQIKAEGTLLGIEPESFAKVTWWREDFGPPIESLMNQLLLNENGILANSQFVRKHRLDIGETFDVDVLGNRVDFTLVGIFDHFPTLYSQGKDQIRFRGDSLVARVDYLDDLIDAKPNEVWLKTIPRQHRQVIAILGSTPNNNLVVNHDGHQLAGVRKEDPLRKGLFGMLTFGFIAATVLSILGYLLFAYLSIQSRTLQFGVLRATGLSVRQLITVLATEQIILIGLGVLLGTALGGGAGWMFTKFLQISIIAREATPPFIVETPWSSINRIYIILIFVFSIALYVSIQLLRRMRIHAILRLGEQ